MVELGSFIIVRCICASTAVVTGIWPTTQFESLFEIPAFRQGSLSYVWRRTQLFALIYSTAYVQQIVAFSLPHPDLDKVVRRILCQRMALLVQPEL